MKNKNKVLIKIKILYTNDWIVRDKGRITLKINKTIWWVNKINWRRQCRNETISR